MTMDELKALGEKFTGSPTLTTEERIVAVVEYQDGTVIDVYARSNRTVRSKGPSREPIGTENPGQTTEAYHHKEAKPGASAKAGGLLLPERELLTFSIKE